MPRWPHLAATGDCRRTTYPSQLPRKRTPERARLDMVSRAATLAREFGLLLTADDAGEWSLSCSRTGVLVGIYRVHTRRLRLQGQEPQRCADWSMAMRNAAGAVPAVRIGR